MRVQGLVDATVRYLEFRIRRTGIKHPALHVRVHECNCADYTKALATQLAALLGEAEPLLETSADQWVVINRFTTKHDLDFSFYQQVYLDQDHSYVDYAAREVPTDMLFDCSMQVPNASQIRDRNYSN